MTAADVQEALLLAMLDNPHDAEAIAEWAADNPDELGGLAEGDAVRLSADAPKVRTKDITVTTPDGRTFEIHSVEGEGP